MKRLFSIAFCTMLMAMLVPTSPGFALPPKEVEVFYFDSNGNEIGWMFRGCDGARLSTGETSSTQMLYSESCQTQVATVGCQYEGYEVSCGIELFWDLCVAHWGEELCSP